MRGDPGDGGDEGPIGDPVIIHTPLSSSLLLFLSPSLLFLPLSLSPSLSLSTTLYPLSLFFSHSYTLIIILDQGLFFFGRELMAEWAFLD